jgi:hypothetical protein
MAKRVSNGAYQISSEELCDMIHAQATALSTLWNLVLDRLGVPDLLDEPRPRVPRKRRRVPTNVIPFRPSRKRSTKELVQQ